MNILADVWVDRSILIGCVALLFYAGSKKRAGLFWIGVLLAITFGSVPH